MATYYKYAERQADSFVNWAEIGKNLTDMLQTETAIREEKKDAIDKATRELGDKLANAPTGESDKVNAWTLGYASDAQEARLLQDRLLRSGGLKVKDYTIMRQNINDGTTSLFNIAKEYQAEFKEKMERAKSNDPATRSQDLEGFYMSSVEGFANFELSKPIINPTDFSISIGIMEPDPNNKGVLRLTDKVSTVNALRDRIKTRYDYFDSTKASETVASGLAKYTVSKIGEIDRLNKTITSVQSITERPDWEKILNQSIKSYLTNPFNITSILTNDLDLDDKNREYTFSNTDKSGGNIIFMNANGQPEFTKEQEEAAFQFMKGQTMQRFERDEAIKTFSLQQRQSSGTGTPTSPTGPPSGSIKEKYLQSIRTNTGLNLNAFAPSGSATASNLQAILSQVYNGTELSVESDEKVNGLVNLMRGDNVVRSFNVYKLNAENQKKYLNEFEGIISSLAGTNGMIDYLSQQSGGGTGEGPNYGDK